jgi:hypothetical protein
LTICTVDPRPRQSASQRHPACSYNKQAGRSQPCNPSPSRCGVEHKGIHSIARSLKNEPGELTPAKDIVFSAAMALIQTSLIWVAYAVAIAILLAIASIFVFLYQKPRDRAASVTIVCIFTTLALLATVLLIPVDVALVSSTSRSSQGRKKDWATPEKVDSIVHTLEIVYYTLYSLDALLCLIVVPFTYFWYEEYDEDAAEHGEQTAGQRFWGAFKYTIAFLLFVVALFLVGFFVPFAKQAKDDKRLDLDYFKHLLSENRKHAPHIHALCR